MMAASLFAAGLIALTIFRRTYFYFVPNLLNFALGKNLQPSNCKVLFDWEDPKTVGGVVAFTVKFYQRNGKAYSVSGRDQLDVNVSVGSVQIATTYQIGESGSNSDRERLSPNEARINFTARLSGLYRIEVKVDKAHVRGSPFFKTFLPGPPDPIKTQLIKPNSIVVCATGSIHSLAVEPRDKFNNLCHFRNAALALSGYDVAIHESDSGESVPGCARLIHSEMTEKINLSLQFDSEGCYRASVFLNGNRICHGEFDVIVLRETDAELVEKNVANKNHEVWYEAKLLANQSETLQEPKQVFCYITPRELIVKEFFLKFIPMRVATFRLCPSTKLHFGGSSEKCDWPIFAVEDGHRQRTELASRDRNVIGATFARLLMENVGGSNTFKEKQAFFYREVRKFHMEKRDHHSLAKTILIKVHRGNLLESSMGETKHFSASDWCKNFNITFLGEQGLDYGGLLREWFDLLSSSLFDSRNELFKSFSDDQQGLVHPNPRRPSNLSLKMYEFAGKIVGKCLYESALGESSRQLVKARFTRSFLAQLIGLKIQYKYFEQDDPDLYLSKIKYIEENDVGDMDLFFAEEEYSRNGQLIKTVDLIPNGSKIPVTNETKKYYLDRLAQYRLATTVKAEVYRFMKGLNELIPDSLLTIFDENELELLLCGTKNYDVADFKANHVVWGGYSLQFQRVLKWFWVAVSNFTPEEFARLLQFTTGCSQLPPGGFRELCPPFTLVADSTFEKLPTAHTCFNQLKLPGYSSYEKFETALLLAINEGSEEFGFA